jgi:hypothetical protein
MTRRNLSGRQVSLVLGVALVSCANGTSMPQLNGTSDLDGAAGGDTDGIAGADGGAAGGPAGSSAGYEDAGSASAPPVLPGGCTGANCPGQCAIPVGAHLVTYTCQGDVMSIGWPVAKEQSRTCVGDDMGLPYVTAFPLPPLLTGSYSQRVTEWSLNWTATGGMGTVSYVTSAQSGPNLNRTYNGGCTILVIFNQG